MQYHVAMLPLNNGIQTVCLNFVCDAAAEQRHPDCMSEFCLRNRRASRISGFSPPAAYLCNALSGAVHISRLAGIPEHLFRDGMGYGRLRACQGALQPCFQ